ncbi:Ig-like domain-containing protein [Leifsonia sp. 22587]|uniref:Ig-like domain-containing protein n=1 Tax=Leifsonia sp. 22587 TaxID=3453946 RepID=UPI003F87C85B
MRGQGVGKLVSAFTALAVGALLALGAGAAPASASFATQCGAPTRVLDAGASSVSLATGETVLLASGTFAGGVDALPSGATLCVGAGAVLRPSYVNNASGALVVAPGALAAFPSIAVGTGFALGVEGTVEFAGLNVNGASTFTVAGGGSLTIAGGFAPSAGTFDNAGTMTISGPLSLNSGARIENSNDLRIVGDANLNGRLQNTGNVEIAGSLTVNGGGMFANDCRVRTTGALSNNSATSANAGIVIAGGVFTNNGTWRQSVEGLLSSTGLTDDGEVSGFGSYRFAGPTSVQGRFTGDSPGTPIQVQTQAPAGSIFDVQTGVVANVVRVAATRAATLDAPLSGCTVNAVPFADLSVSKSGPATVLQNGDVTYTLVVANAGPDDAEGVVLTDTLPAGVSGVVDAGGGTVAGGTISWAIGTLAPGASTARTFTVSQAAAVGTVLHDVASAISDTDDPDPSNNDGSSADSQADTTVVGVAPPPNSPPVAQPLTRPGFTAELLFGRVSATDPDTGQKLTYTITTPPVHGRALVVAGGGFGYRSADDFTGDDSFVYTVCDDGTPVLCDSATVSLPISPIAVDDSAETSAGAPVVIPISANDSLGAALSPALTTPPSNGTATVDAVAGTIRYTPAGGFTGQDAFQYRICSPTNPSLCATATVTVTVRPLNNPPVVASLQLTTTVATPVTRAIRATDPDPGQTLAFARGIPPRTGTATVSADQTTYLPRTVFAGTDQYSVIVCDDGVPVLCATGLVDVDIYPVANPDSATTPAGTAVSIPVTDNDQGTVGPPTVATPPAHGTATANGPSFVYTPEPGFSGSDAFTYTICASIAPTLCDTTTVTVQVTAGTVGPPDGSGDGSASAAAGRPDGDLAATGGRAPDMPAVWLGLATVAVGGAVVGVAGRRRRSGERRDLEM